MTCHRWALPILLPTILVFLWGCEVGIPEDDPPPSEAFTDAGAHLGSARGAYVAGDYGPFNPEEPLSPGVEWARGFAGWGDDIGSGVAVDDADQVHLVGSFWRAIDFGGGELVTESGYDVVHAVYSAEGKHVASRNYGGAGNHFGNGIATGGVGTAIMTGSYTSRLKLRNGELQTIGHSDAFVLSIPTDGSAMWARTLGGTDHVRGTAVARGPAGEVYVVGTFTGRADFGGGAVASNGGTDVFVVAYDRDGGYRWSKRFGGAQHDYALGVAAGYHSASQETRVVLVGAFAGESSGFVVSLSGAGERQWSQSFGRTGAQHVNGVVFDGAGNTTVLGWFDGSADFGLGVVQSKAGDGFVASYSESGKPRWANVIGGAGDDAATAGRTDYKGNITVTGRFSDVVDFGVDNHAELESAGGTDVFVTGLTADGKPVWAQRFGGAGDDSGMALDLRKDGGPVVAGYYELEASMIDNPLPVSHNKDMFLLSLSSQ